MMLCGGRMLSGRSCVCAVLLMLVVGCHVATAVTARTITSSTPTTYVPSTLQQRAAQDEEFDLAAVSPPASSVDEHWIKQLQEAVNGTQLRDYLKHLTSTSHLAGTTENLQVAHYIRDTWRAAGISTAELWPFRSFMSYPVSRSAKMVQPYNHTCKLKEPPIPEDPTSKLKHTPLYNGWGATGSVRNAEVVYVNYGLASDFEELEKLSPQALKGRVAIMRYGNSFRAAKVQLAQEHGAAAVILYSDPADTGYVKGSVFPKGPWGPARAAQRGTVDFTMICPGNPTRPGGYCLADPRINATSILLPKIPVQPMSWEDAYPLLKALKGAKPVPDSWQGGLNFTYEMGPGPTRVDMDVVNKREFRQLQNVVGYIEGSQTSDEQVFLGNHYDAWVFGASDPGSGTTALMELVRVLGALYKDGWRPKRRIVFAAWDAEEFGLIGSTAYGESMLREDSNRRTVAYLNVDMAVSGDVFEASGSPCLRSVLMRAAKYVPAPPGACKAGCCNVTKDISIYDAWWCKDSCNMQVLGSGSDYTVFLDHMGVPSMDFRLDGAYGVYHSVYDSFTWMDKFGDPSPGWPRHVSMTRLWGVTTLLLAGSETVDAMDNKKVVASGVAGNLLPLDFEETGVAMQDYAKQAEALCKSEGAPECNFAPLFASIDAFMQNVEQFSDRTKDMWVKTLSENAATNDMLMKVERAFLQKAGLPGRYWYKHVLQAPGLHDGYGAQVLPGVEQALLDHNWDIAALQIGAAADLIDSAAELIREANHGEEKYLVPVIIGAFIGVAIVFLFVYAYRTNKAQNRRVLLQRMIDTDYTAV